MKIDINHKRIAWLMANSGGNSVYRRELDSMLQDAYRQYREAELSPAPAADPNWTCDVCGGTGGHQQGCTGDKADPAGEIGNYIQAATDMANVASGAAMRDFEVAASKCLVQICLVLDKMRERCNQ